MWLQWRAALLVSAMLSTTVPVASATHERAVEFAWPPEWAEGMGVERSTAAIERSIGWTMDIIDATEGKQTSVEIVNESHVRIVSQILGKTRTVELQYNETRADYGGTCEDERVNARTGEVTRYCDPPGSYPERLSVGWKDRPDALFVDQDNEITHVTWVLRHGRLAATEANATAMTLWERLGIPMREGKTGTPYASVSGEILLHRPENEVERFTNGEPTAETLAAGRERVALSCVCTEYTFRPHWPRWYGDALHWAVDPEGFVAWVQTGVHVDFDRTHVLSIEERDAAVEAYRAERGLQLMVEVNRFLLDEEAMRMYWEVDLRHPQRDPDPGRINITIARLDAHNGTWTLELDRGVWRTTHPADSDGETRDEASNGVAGSPLELGGVTWALLTAVGAACLTLAGRARTKRVGDTRAEDVT